MVSEARLGAGCGVRPAAAPACGRRGRWQARAASPRRWQRGRGGRASRGRAERRACTPRPSTGGTSRACSCAAPPRARLRDGGGVRELVAHASTAAACASTSTIACCCPTSCATSLGLRGTHVGCEHGVCGACTVQLDGRAVRSCLMLAAQAEGCHVETVESLADPEGPLSPLQDAFRRHHALQCGFCTPGILMSAGELLADRRHARRGARSRSCSRATSAAARATSRSWTPSPRSPGARRESRRAPPGVRRAPSRGASRSSTASVARRTPSCSPSSRARPPADWPRAACGPGDRVAAALKNRFETADPVLGVAVAGRRLRPAQLAPASRRADLLRGRLRSARAGDRGRLGRGRRGRARHAADRGRGRTGGRAARGGRRARRLPSAADEREPALMLYTSGTTGRPKGVPRSHRAERAAALAQLVQLRAAAGRPHARRHAALPHDGHALAAGGERLRRASSAASPSSAPTPRWTRWSASG